MKNIKKLLTKNKLLLLGLAIFNVLLIIGTSYAIYQIVNTQTDENLVDVGCFNVSITKQENAINLENAYPISDEKGKSLTPFTFTLTNNCNVTGKYTVNLEVLKDSTMSTSFVKTLVNNGTISKLDALPKADTKNGGSIEARTLASGILTPNSSVDYSVSLWMDESVTIEDGAMNKILKSKIVVISKALSQITSDDPITQSIIAQLDTTGKCPKVNADGTMQLTDAETGSGYLCSAPDNYGLSYYYRGDVTNNYVQFGKWPDDVEDVVYGYESPSEDSERIPSYKAFSSMDECQKASDYNNNCTVVSRKGKPMYWRILRINGDGTVRLVYDGTNTYSNGQYSLDRQVSTDIVDDSFGENFDFSFYMNILDNAGVGYMYGNASGVVESTKAISESFSSSSTYYLAKEYTFSLQDGFKLTDAVQLSGDKITDDYIGYYLTSDSSDVPYLEKIITLDKDKNEGTVKFITYGTSSKEQAQKNEADSLYKVVMDSFYNNNIKGKNYESYIADNLFCNDRTISNATSGDESITNKGFGSNYTVYRWASYTNNLSNIISSPTADSVNSTLYCSSNDSFSVNSSHGNGALSYSIGTLTADEVSLAGAFYGKENNKYYLYNGISSLLMTPFVGSILISLFGFPMTFSTSIEENGSLGASNIIFGNSISAVINLKQGALKSGTGTREDPYRIDDSASSPKVNIASYINNNETDKIPVSYKKNKYSVEKVECDNNVSGTWNTDKWDLDTSNVTQDSTCKVYFKHEPTLTTEYYVDGNKSGITPETAKINNYAVDKVECNNDVTGTWNTDKWELDLSNFNKDATCKIYFKKQVQTVKIANQTFKVDEFGKCPNLNQDGSVNVTEIETTDGYLCSAPDKYGTSYYYRGNVTNNYVKFAGFYWRIVRFNGDSTVRVIYDGTSAHANGDSSSDRLIGTSAFNGNSNDNAYVGYMYGTIGASNYAATHANIHDSTIKTYIDNWYKKNIYGKLYVQYLSDNIFCNDRSLGVYGDKGYGTETTRYHWYGFKINTSNLKCPQQNDAFTVNDTINGNGALTYPVGLLSIDEIALAGGGGGTSNEGYYLHTGNEWISLTPSGFDSRVSFRYVSGGGRAMDNTGGMNNLGVRPVLNLKANALNAGTGTADDPYRIS